MDAPFPADLLPAWEEFLSAPRTLDDLLAHPLLFPLQRRREMEKMFEVAAGTDLPRSYMEIGADKGGGLWAWLKTFPHINRVIACEIRGTPYRDLFERAFPHVEFLWLPWSSRYSMTSVLVRRFCADRGKLDVLFLDGDKLGFRQDWDAYRSLVRDGGTVFLHDITDHYASAAARGPGDVWDRLAYDGDMVRRPGFDEIIDRSEADEACERERAGVPPASEHEAWLRHWHGRSCGVGVVHV